MRTRMYVRHAGQWEAIGREHGAVFASIRPASTLVEVSGLVDPGMLVEIEADACVDRRRRLNLWPVAGRTPDSLGAIPCVRS